MVVLKRAFIFLSLLSLLLGCSVSKAPEVKYQPLYDFSQITSYSLYPREDEFNDWQPLIDSTRNSIEHAIENVLDTQQLSLKPVEEADVAITYYWVKHNAGNLRSYNAGVNYCSYCLTHAKSDTKQRRLAIVPNSLIIDVVKPKSRRSIWRASYPLNIKNKDSSLEVNTKIVDAVDRILAQFTFFKNIEKPSV